MACSGPVNIPRVVGYIDFDHYPFTIPLSKERQGDYDYTNRSGKTGNIDLFAQN